MDRAAGFAVGTSILPQGEKGVPTERDFR
jgi:hypothetical protein